MKYNSPQQNKNCLNNFDLTEYRQILSDVAIRIYHQFVVVMENSIQPIIGKKRVSGRETLKATSKLFVICYETGSPVALNLISNYSQGCSS